MRSLNWSIYIPACATWRDSRFLNIPWAEFQGNLVKSPKQRQRGGIQPVPTKRIYGRIRPNGALPAHPMDQGQRGSA